VSQAARPEPSPLRAWGATRFNFSDRLLAEALRCAEQESSADATSADAERRARAHDGTLEERILVRARHHGHSRALRDGLDHLHQAVTLGVLVVIVAGALAGAATARTTLGVGASDRVNVFWALLSLLGAQTLLLLGWLLLLILRPGALVGGSLGGFVLRAAQRMAGWSRRGSEHAAPAAAWAGAMLRSPVGRWTVGSISHAAWLAFNLGAGAVLIAMLGTRHYTFVWETTILSPREYVPLTQALAAVPRKAGFIVPDPEQIRSSQWPPAEGQAPPGPESAAAWSGFLLGSMVVYGFGPRLVFLGLCLSLRRRAAARYRLDLGHAGFSPLAARLGPDHRGLGVIDADAGLPPPVAAPRREPAAVDPSRPNGPPAILGYEIAPPRSTWPPPLHRGRWLDLGFVEDRAGQQRVIAALSTSAEAPRMVIVAAALTATPDRGVARFLEEVRAAARSPVGLVLTAGAALRQRGALAEPRVADWREMAGRAGIDAARVVEIDLDHLTDRSLEGLEALLAGAAAGAGAPAGLPGQVGAAFELIARQAGRWAAAPEPPDLEQQAELQRGIARLYRRDQERWKAASLFQAIPIAGASPQELARALGRGADRVVGLLPPGLRLRPRWMAAGALAGALGCVAAATVISPVAIGALPLWSGIGAAVSALLQPARRREEDDQPVAAAELDQAVRAAALFAALLELQGHDEAKIGRVLERAFAEPADAPGLSGAESVAAWLAERRHRIELALAAEART
jgi:hypothetical protein